jgi:trigger factor
VTGQELQQAVVNEARKYSGKERQVFEFYQKNQHALEGLKAPIYEDKVVDFVLERTTIAIRQVPIEELTKAVEQEPPRKGKTVKKAEAKVSKDSGEKKEKKSDKK